jgi:hypothetical protein
MGGAEMSAGATSRVLKWATRAVSVGLFIGAFAPTVNASNPYLVIPPPREAEDTFAYRTANLSNVEAFAELERRHIPYRKENTPLPGVRAPIRLTGPLRGVFIHSSLPESERATTPFEILDARLAIALDELCKILATHDIVEVVHFTMYRPPGTQLGDPNLAQNRHPGGMAIDLGAVKKRSGEWLSVGHHWSASVGSKTCGPDARKLEPRKGRELISIVCEVADQRIFHYMLSPHFDQHHHDHLHLEIKTGAQSFLVN